jgi:hypothetical protein
MNTMPVRPETGPVQVMYPPPASPSDWPQSLGRNGPLNTAGVSVLPLRRSVELMPVTSRGGLGRCTVSLPRDPATLRALAQVLLALAERS